MEKVYNFFTIIGKTIPIIISMVLTSLGVLFLDLKRKNDHVFETERSYFELTNRELMNIYMDITTIIMSSDRLSVSELESLYYVMQNFRVWCLDLHEFEAKYKCGSALYYHLHLFEVQYKDKVDTTHSLEYVELNALNLINRINKLKMNII